MSKPPEGLSNPSMASASQEGERSPLLVTLLSSEWRSSTDRNLSPLIRELAIQLAKHPSVQVSVFLSQCSEDDKKVAASHKVKLIKAEKLIGFDPVDWLINIPEDHVIDCIIGHGVHLGRQIPCIQRNHRCRWIQIVHTVPEELAMHKSNRDAIPKGEKMQQAEIELCELADQVVAVGPKLADTYRGFLCSSKKHQKIIDLTPSIFTEFKDVQQATEGRRTFCVLVIGSGDSEDFNLKGYDLAAEAIAQLKEKSYQLKFVCAPRGKEYEIAKKLLEHGIDRSQLIVRKFNENRETLARLFCEVDLAIMPSRSEGFGLAGLEALSAGLPVLVSRNSGLGEALLKVPTGQNCVVDAEDPKHWASKIKAVCEKDRDVRLAESKLLREEYLKKYSWQEPCGALVEKMQNLVTALKLGIDVESMESAEQSTQGRTASSKKPGGPQNGEQLEASTEPVPSGHTEPLSTETEAPQTPTHTPTKEQVLCLFADSYLKNVPPKSKDEHVEFLTYLNKMRLIITGHCEGSLLITVKCDSLQILDRLWEDYLSGHLGEVVQRSFVTEELLAELSLAELKLKTTISEEEYEVCRKYFEKDPARGNVASQRVRKIATPLCLPNNCKWDSRSGQYTRTGGRRDSLYVVQEALQILRKVKGPVCVVSIAGPYRKGKSWVLSQAFNQPEVFPLAHEMVAETMGIWLWIVPEKYTDSKGQEFTVVLLDSEGIDAATGESLDDNQIFTLTVLLASALIYNSQGVPTRRDLEGLDFIVKLTHRIEMRSTTTQGTGKGHRDSQYFHKTFPFFMWLLRDVTQAIPSDCSNIKEYFLKKVFKVQDSSAVAQEGQKVAESILSFFPGFEAFTLPSPTVNPETMKSINDNKDDINPLFFTGLEEFKRLLWNVLVPKKSFNGGEVVTGEGLAALVEQYVLAINTPGVVPNVQNAWDSFVEAKCSDTLKDALDAYEVAMTTQLKNELPCNNDQLRRSHEIALQNSENHFMADTAGISINSIEKYLKKLKELLGERFNLWQIKNATSTREFCSDLLIQLKQAHLDPVLQQLRCKGGAKLSFDDIIGGYNRIKDDYDKSAIGAKDIIAAVFFEFHPELMKEQEQHLGLLRQLKDYDEKLTQELAAKAYQEQEKQRLEEQQEQLCQENRAVKREMEMLSEKQSEERQKFREQMNSELRAQREQMNNMMEANMEQAQQERERFMQENQELKNQFLAMQKTNEENIKMIKKLSDLVSMQEEEKRRLDEQMEKAKQAESERQESLQRMEARHREEKEKLRREMETKIEAQRNALTEEYRKAAEARMDMMYDMQEKLEQVEEQLEEVKKPGLIKRAVSKIKEFGGAVVDKVKENCSLM